MKFSFFRKENLNKSQKNPFRMNETDSIFIEEIITFSILPKTRRGRFWFLF